MNTEYIVELGTLNYISCKKIEKRVRKQLEFYDNQPAYILVTRNSNNIIRIDLSIRFEPVDELENIIWNALLNEKPSEVIAKIAWWEVLC